MMRKSSLLPAKFSSFFFFGDTFRGNVSSGLAASPFPVLPNFDGKCLRNPVLSSSSPYVFLVLQLESSTHSVFYLLTHSFMFLLLSSLGCPRQSLLLALHTCAPPRFPYLYFLSFTQQLCSSLPLSVSLPQDYHCLFICLQFPPQKPSGQSSLCLSLDCFFLNLSLFLSGCLILTKASKRGKKRGRAYSKSCSQVAYFFFFKGKQEV